MTIKLPGWRFCVLFAETGCAGALAYRGDWVLAGIAAAFILLPAAVWVRGELAATRVMLGGSGKHRGRGWRNVAATLRAMAKIPLP